MSADACVGECGSRLNSSVSRCVGGCGSRLNSSVSRYMCWWMWEQIEQQCQQMHVLVNVGAD